ncbi:MAG: aldehyde dehydrogenase family protein [Bacteroidales bacterium]|jgi:aldehyde dehydrogenase (NAD+)|nr:aldehyde dehydrogenase family protein [Bacteroidales bacterium]MDD2633060.1 aldehyde dehydrogenase family protein [Bacteroidales bacterium]MDD4176155.1 aldehyde dehydrogenase family protein [Bacteroidales bacterium]MDD4740558.1 aldehyde dehydrogenase family protein [Bacteroidales bacterium]MDY0335062.1 aldehyde dehydrogenase family protein [Bacteroidales bacterium]
MKDFNIKKTLEELGIKDINNGLHTGRGWVTTHGEVLESYSPNDGQRIAGIRQATWDDYEQVVVKAQEAFKVWRMEPAPKRGEIVRQIGNELRRNKEALGRLVSYEMGKVYQEGLGEVQEMIDIADFAVGQSRQLYGYTMHSEREQHRMFDQYHPLGIVGVISAFNFPVAVWAWNAMIALIAGDVVLWKPSSKVMLSAIATHNIIEKVLRDNDIPEGVLSLVAASSKYVGDDFLKDRRIALVSVTGSTRVGKRVNNIVGARLGKTILELGGNNAIIISQYANLNLALRASIFGATATAGQRCTSTRRLIIHERVYDLFKDKIVHAYKQLRIGHALDEKTHVGPLIDKAAVETFVMAQEAVKKAGGKIIYGGEVPDSNEYPSGCYVRPAIAEVENHWEIVQEETFAPLLYLIKYKTIEEAIELHNSVPQGLSSAIFSKNIHETELFLSHAGSDCGIANVNIATNGAEIGGAFGGEKDTGGGRESGSDAWKAYMRRQTNTINYSKELPLAQGIKFDLFEE